MILDRLEQAGWEAYLVGGCVRDSLLGKTPQDWDMATSARPEQLLACFGDTVAIPTGLRHGTVTVRLGGSACQVTSYRTEWGTADSRHPQQVRFGCSLQEDLKRRDFTINAMAYHPQRGLVDLFGGRQDLQAGLIRCVGDPDLRFREDALRILRALRFASTYGFSIQPQTAEALRRNRLLIQRVSAERIWEEFCRFLMGQGAAALLRRFPEVAAVFLPELAPCFGFDQRNPHHHLDVWGHTVEALADTPPDLVVRLAVLFHDIGKPDCFTVDVQGVGHCYGHGRHSGELAEGILRRLRCGQKLADQVVQLVRRHDAPLDTRQQMLRMLGRLGEEQLRRLLLVKRADLRAHAPADIPLREEQLRQSQALLEALLAEQACFSRKDLAVDGRALLGMGFPQGPQVGRCLQRLLEEVVDGRLENHREPLLRRALQILEEPVKEAQ